MSDPKDVGHAEGLLPFQSAFTVNPAPHAAAPASPPPGSITFTSAAPPFHSGVGTITFHTPNGDVTKEYNPLGPHISDFKEQPASARQVGGSHYKDYVIQPAEFITRNKLGFLEGCIIKRVCRYMKKGDNWKEDLLKARHELDLLIEFIEKEQK